MRDYYEVLGVEKTATNDDIKKAYRQLAHKYHPDKQGGDQQRFKEINEAYQVLSDKNKRSQYDRFGSAGFGQGQNPFAGFDFSGGGAGMPDMEDIFDIFFGGGGAGGWQKRKSYRKGADLQYGIQITLKEAWEGVKKKIEFDTFIKCDDCTGKGFSKDKGTKECKTCSGAGEVKESKRTFFGSFTKVKECTECGGSGEIPNEPCPKCKGKGRIKGQRQLEVDILAGVANGQIIKVASKGEAGERGTEEGDLYVKVIIKENPEFRRQGDDLLTIKELDLVDLLLGKKVIIKALSGKDIKVEIPAGFNLNETVTIPEEGMPRFGSWNKGNLVIKFEVRTPKKLSKKAKDILESFKKEIESGN